MESYKGNSHDHVYKERKSNVILLASVEEHSQERSEGTQLPLDDIGDQLTDGER